MNMKTNITKVMAVAALTTVGSATAVAQDRKLPEPNQSQPSMSVVEALATRHSVREYAKKKLSFQDISNLCWAACGKARDYEHRTAPTAMNRKEIRLFVFTDKNVSEYDARENMLRHVADGDHRNILAGGNGFTQDFVLQAPVSLVMVIDFNLFGSSDSRALMMGCVDAGNVSENINLYCQAVGLATVPRATMDIEAVRTLLNLTDKQLPIMNNPVGWPKK